MRIKNLPWRAFAFSALLSVAFTIGCGSGINYGNPTTSIAATKHPLVAQYNITLPHKGATAWVEFGTDTSYGRQTSTTAPTAGYRQTVTVLVAGMRPSTTYHMRAHVDWYGGSWIDQDQTFTTGSLSQTHAVTSGSPGGPLVAPRLAVTRPNPSMKPQAGVELFSTVLPTNPDFIQTFVTDLEGNIIWYYNGGAVPIKPMSNGHFLLNAAGDLLEVDLAGNTIRDVSLNQVNASLQANSYSFRITNFHHDQLILPNGHWIALANTFKAFTNLPGYPGVTHVLGDVLLDIDLSGNVVWAWSGFDHLDINRHPLGLSQFNGGADWTHANAIDYTADGNLLLSMRNQSWILKIDYKNGTGAGDILWRLGEQGDFAITGGDPRQWFYGEHNPNIIAANGSQTKLTVWDNGNARVNPDDSTCGTVVPCYSRATIFEVDENTKVANVLWDHLPGFYSFWGGSIEALNNGNVEYDVTDPFGFPASRVVEVTQTANPQVVWQLDLTGEFAYRAYRIPSLYPGVSWKQ